MTKTHKLPKNIFFAFFATIMLAISCLLASCGGPSEPPATMYSVTWDVSEKATVAVEGHEGLPTQVAEDTDLVFTVTAAEGYEVSRVTRDSKKVTAKDGKYTINITKDIKIGVETGKVVTGIEVTKNPTKLTYFAGDALDVAGMEVKVNYATGDSEVITKGADGYLVSPSIFEGGETSFKVVYGDFEAVVNLDGRVEYLVTIDPAGGTIADSWLGSVEALGLKNYNVANNGVITFSYYNNLPTTINLPTEAEISRTDFTFKGWSNAAAITNASGTFSTTAGWQAELVVVSGVEIVAENDHPYLVVHGQFKVANEVYLYLYEGNAKVSFTGDTYTNTTGENGAAFEVKFDLLRLAEATAEDGSSFEGKWMDIRFNAKLGEREESMELFVGEGSLISVNLNQKVEAAGYAFLFATYADMLKVYYNKVHYSYSVAQEGNNVAIIGNAKLYKGATMLLTAWAGSAEVELATTTIDATTGEFKLVIEIASIPVDTNCYCHVTITSADGEALHGDANTNFKIASCTNQSEMVKLEKKLGDVTHAIKMTNADGIAAYVGYQWDGLIIYARDEARSVSYDLASIELIDGSVYYVFSGKVKGYKAEELTYGMQFQHNSNIDGTGWDYAYDGTTLDERFTAKVTGEDYRVEVPVETIMSPLWDGSASIWAFSVKTIFNDKVTDFKPAGVTADYAVKNGVKYSIRQDGSTWDMAALVMEPTDEADGAYVNATYTYDSATITNVNERAILTVSGTYTGIDAAKLSTLFYVDFQAVGPWNYVYPENVTLTAENGVWTLVIDVTDLEANPYVCHACVGQTCDPEKGPNLSFKEGFTETVAIGAKSYTILSVPGSSQQSEFWGALGLTVTQA